MTQIDLDFFTNFKLSSRFVHELQMQKKKFIAVYYNR